MKLIEFRTVGGNKVAINVDKIIDVYCTTDGNAAISLGTFQNEEYSYKVQNYSEVIRMLKEVME